MRRIFRQGMKLSLLVCALLLLATGGAVAGDWAKDKNGYVPKSAYALEKGVYAVKGMIPSMTGGKVEYPGVLNMGTKSAEIFGQAQKQRVNSYTVYLPKARWCKGTRGQVPHGSVQFGDDGGPLYFIRAVKNGQTCYGVLPNNMAGTPYVYCGSMPEFADSYEALCK